MATKKKPTTKDIRKSKPQTATDRLLRHYKEQAASLGKELDAALDANEALYDRLMLAIDGGRPPSGVLHTVEALRPFAGFAETLGQNTGDQTLLNWVLDFEAKPRVYRTVTVADMRAAARTLAWIEEHRLKGKRGHFSKCDKPAPPSTPQARWSSMYGYCTAMIHGGGLHPWTTLCEDWKAQAPAPAQPAAQPWSPADEESWCPDGCLCPEHQPRAPATPKERSDDE